jgi:hypothetical protein
VEQIRLKVKKGYKDEWVVDVPIGEYKEVYLWCKQTFGDPGRDRNKYRWRAGYVPLKYYNGYSLFLRHADDVTLFTLKWA